MAVLELLEQTSLPRILVFLLEEHQTNITLLKQGIDASQQAIYKALDLLRDAGLIIDRKNGKPPFERVIRISEKGNYVASRLAYLFDETKRIILIPKEQYDELQTVLDWIGEGTVETFLSNVIAEKIKHH